MVFIVVRRKLPECSVATAVAPGGVPMFGAVNAFAPAVSVTILWITGRLFKPSPITSRYVPGVAVNEKLPSAAVVGCATGAAPTVFGASPTYMPAMGLPVS